MWENDHAKPNVLFPEALGYLLDALAEGKTVDLDVSWLDDELTLYRLEDWQEFRSMGVEHVRILPSQQQMTPRPEEIW